MRLILFDLDGPQRRNFYPLSLSRPIWELRCGMSTLGEKLVVATGVADVACFVPAYLEDAYRARCACPVNDASTLLDDDLLLVSGRIKPEVFEEAVFDGSTRLCRTEDDEPMMLCVAHDDLERLDTGSIEGLLSSAAQTLGTESIDLPAWRYTWELVLANPDQISADFVAAGRVGIEGTVEQPCGIRGSRDDVYIAPGATVHPMVVIDAEHGPVYLDQNVEVHPFTRIEGPCYVGPGSILLGAKCREGNSIGPVCRVGGEIEESIIQGYSSKYHDGFLGHAYVGEWVNLGALTTNSDLKNDYGQVEVILDGRKPVNTGSMKVGALIGDHTKTSIGTLLNTGAYVGAMSLIMTHGKPLGKYIPDFSWLLDGNVTKGFGKRKLYDTAKVAMSRRKQTWTDAEQAMWDAVFEITAPQRDEYIARGRRRMLKK
ncbi:MAG: hypothetical protein CMJ18_23840 [Phycisphaeraceae bacterium]|nr:hypothetical protein [Phycisphaeraceae bacterium]